MITITQQACAKINLTLDVLGKRPDGYHDILSIMQTVSLCDSVQIRIGTGKPWEIICDQPGVPSDRKNLVWKAAEVFFQEIDTDPDGLQITIQKRIPMEAGLGGGSSDAAAVLRGLNRAYSDPISIERLAQLGGSVGSDVPFCVIGGAAMAEGRGERLRSIPAMPPCDMVICKPQFSSSTPALYKKLDEMTITHRPDQKAMEKALENGDLWGIAGNLCNVFEPVVAGEHEEIAFVRKICAECGAMGVCMTGSGSAVYGIFPDKDSAQRTKERLINTGIQAFLAHPV